MFTPCGAPDGRRSTGPCRAPAAVGGIEVVIAGRGIATAAMGGVRAVDAIVEGLPARPRHHPRRVLLRDLVEAIAGARRELRRAVRGEADQESLPELQQDAGVHVVERQVDLRVLEIGVVGQRGHHAIGVAERELDAVGGAPDVLGDDDVRSGSPRPRTRGR